MRCHKVCWISLSLIPRVFPLSPQPPIWEINPSQTWESEKGTVYVLRGMTICGWRSNKGALLQWPHSDKDLWCVENRVGWAPAPLLELWLLMHQTLPPCPALCQRHISPPIGPFQQIRCFENDFQGAVGSHSDDIKWKEQKRKKIIAGDKQRWFRMTQRTSNGLVWTAGTQEQPLSLCLLLCRFSQRAN